MKLIVIFGPSAVGKMTVGYELQKITDLKADYEIAIGKIDKYIYEK